MTGEWQIEGIPPRKKGSASAPVEGTQKPLRAPDDQPSARRGPVTDATRALAALIAAGLPLTRALEATRDVSAPSMGPVLDGVLERVRKGSSLADALADFGSTFSPVYVGVIRAGERGGRLVSVMDGLADQLEKEADVRARLVSAAAYPLTIGLLGGLSVLALVLFVVPRFAELVTDVGGDLPGTTRFVLGISGFITSNWPALLALIVLGTVGFLAALRSEAGRVVVSRTLLRVPLLGPLMRDLLARRFSRLLAVLLEGGAPIVTALDDLRESVGDPAASAEIDRMQDEVRTGQPFHVSVSRSDLFPPELGRLVAVGEEASRLPEFLGRAADYFEKRSERNVSRLVTLLEPAMIVLFGGIVALVALSLLQTIYGVNVGGFG